jgi:nitroreductase
MILDLLRKRCSVRYFSEVQISESIISDIVEAGRLSPSGGNEQPWKFGVITDKEQIKLISEAAFNQTWISTAPLLIVLCCTIVSDSRGAREIQKKRFPKWKKDIENMDKKLYSYLNLEEHQTKIPGTHMVLEALEKGIFSTWVSYFDVEKVSMVLNLPEFYIPSEIIAFGYPADRIQTREKKKIEEVIFHNRYL